MVTAVREKCDDDEDRLERLAFCSVKAGPRVTICRATLPSDLRFAMLVGCLAGSIIKPRAWDCPGNKLRSQWEQSAGSLCPNRCPRARRLRAARKHFRSLSKWSGTWRDCCR